MSYSLFDRRVTMKRASASVLDARQAAQGITPDRQPVLESLIEVTATGAGTVVLSGTVLETLSFSAADVLTSENTFTSLTGISCSLAAGSTVSARAIGRDGAPQNRFSTLATGQPAALNPSTGKWRGERSGATEEQDAHWMLAWTTAFEPREGDQLVDDSTGAVYGVRGVDVSPDPYRPEWWDVRASRPR